MTDNQIREIFLANGFTIKEGQTDLKPYVYAAARALINATLEEAAVKCESAYQRGYIDGRSKPVEAALKPGEPVAWLHEWSDGEQVVKLYGRDNRANDQPIRVTPLYAHPPRRERDAVLKHVLALLGPEAPECSGCAAEWETAIAAIKGVLEP